MAGREQSKLPPGVSYTGGGLSTLALSSPVSRELRLTPRHNHIPFLLRGEDQNLPGHERLKC